MFGRLKPTSDAGYHEYRTKCLEGTRETIINDVCDWASNEHSTKILWLNGAAGAGKSTIASSVVDQLSKDFVVASFFCKRDTAGLSSWRKILTTLLYQMARNADLHRFRNILLQNLKENPSLAADQFLPEMEKLVIGVLENVPRDRISKQVIITIDALDECANEEDSSLLTLPRNYLIHFLSRMVQAADWLKVIITSRPYDDIQSSFNRIQSCCDHQNYPLDLNSTETAEDLYKYAQHCVGILVSEYGMYQPSVDEIKLFSKRANGLFIWLATSYRFLCKVVTINEWFKKLLGDSQTSEALPDLYSLYKTVLQECVHNIQDNIEYVKRTLEIIITVFEPVSSSDITTLTCDNEGERGYILKVFNWLKSVVVTDKDDKIYVYHPSFVDFLHSESAGVFQVKDVDANTKIATKCLHSMLSKDGLHFNMCSLKSSFCLNKDVECLQESVQKSISTLLQYCCIYWVKHLVKTTDSDASTYMRKILCSPNILYWMEAMSLLDKFLIAIQSLIELCQWLKVSYFTLGSMLVLINNYIGWSYNGGLFSCR
jgi:hypothetical protein